MRSEVKGGDMWPDLPSSRGICGEKELGAFELAQLYMRVLGDRLSSDIYI